MNAQRRIWVTFQKAGIHKYPQAAMDPALGPVQYLGSPHRHLFKFKVAIDVFHDDREIEFHMFLNWLEGLFNQNILELNNKSCEMISDDIAKAIYDRYPGRSFTIDVSEDGECGSTVEYGV